ncbi:MAG: MATE family efflux transporter [Erysipelotrichaceae bacterium]|nr:MATE family efflux transporter [Erysipelotrichaceae bacterium]
MSKMENKLYEGDVLKTLIIFSLPFLVSNIVQSLYNVADMLIVGNFSGPVAMSGVNIGGQVTFILTNVIIGLCVGATVLIGQYVGSQNEDGLKKVVATIITLLIVLAGIITVVVLLTKTQILTLINTPAESFQESENYLTTTASGIIFIFGYNALAAILRGMGDSKHPFYFVSAACITNIILDLLFVKGFGWAAFGAAFATVISQAMSCILCIIYLMRNNFLFDFRLKSYKIDRQQLKLIVKIGLPNCIQNGVSSMSFLFITSIVNKVGGMIASAAVGAAGKFNSFAFMPTNAISASVSTMSAQNIGANKMDRAVKTAIIGTIFAVTITYSFMVFTRMYPAQILSLFGNDPDMIAAGVEYLSTFTFDFLFIPIIFCINGFLIGGGHTVFSLITSLVSSIFLRVPVCYFFGVVMGWGIKGVGLGAPAASAGTLVIIIGFLLSGRWKHNVVRATPIISES